MTRARGPLHLWRKGFNPYTRTGWWLRNICYQKDVILANQKMASAKRLEKRLVSRKPSQRQEKLLPIEKDFSFPHFFSPELTDADFSARPMVMLTGQYSTGKSTFIRHLLGRDYPGLRIGPEPTTDKFVAVCKGDMDQVA